MRFKLALLRIVLVCMLALSCGVGLAGRIQPDQVSGDTRGARPFGSMPVDRARSDTYGVRGTGIYTPMYVPPPLMPDRASNAPAITTFLVNTNPSSCQGNTSTFPPAALAALNSAVDTWSVLIVSHQTIEVDACWRPSLPDATVLADAKPLHWYWNFTGAPRQDTAYPVALANAIADQDLNGIIESEIIIEFNGSISWYYGTDGQASSTQYDLVSVALHELGHGLGFVSWMDRDDGAPPTECNGTAGVGCWQTPPTVYDRFIKNGAGLTLVDSFANTSAALGSQLVSNSLFFDGANANAGNGGTHPRIYAPTTWDPGSSVSHLDTPTYSTTVNALMTHAFGMAQVVHHPGPIALGVMRDIGWTVPSLDNTYVQAGWVGCQQGTITCPFSRIGDGVNAASNGGTVWITPGTYYTKLTVIRTMTLRVNGTGIVVIQP